MENAKAKEAYALFMESNQGMRAVILFGSDYRGKITPERLLAHFDTMDHLGTLDDAIEDMIDDIENDC